MKIKATEKEINEVFERYKSEIFIDPEKGSMFFDGVKITWVRSSIFYILFKKIKYLIGESAYSLIMYAAMEHGANFYRVLKEKYDKEGKELTEEDVLKYTAAEFPAIGWGSIEIEVEENEIRVVAPYGFPAGRTFVDNGERSDIPVDAYVMGYLLGLFSEMRGKKMVGEEVECVARGDERCLMVFKVKE